MQYRNNVARFESASGDDHRPIQHPSPPMPESLPSHMPSEIALKWRALAEQRHAHFLELHQTGRWRHYYSEHDFLLRMREAVDLLEHWNALTTSAAEEKRASGA
jgi:hypothetical protein